MAYFNKAKLPLVAAFFGLPRRDQQQVIDEEREHGTGSAAGLTRNLGRYHEEGARIYELSTPQYATLLDVRSRLGADVGSYVEAYFSGEIASLEGVIKPDDLTIARDIALSHSTLIR